MVDSDSLTSPALRAVNLNFAYPDGTLALRSIDLCIGTGESFAVIGPNGAGKSTLLLCLCGLLHGQGEIFVQGQLLNAKNARLLRRNLGFVFQNPDDQLFMPTLAEDVAFGPLNLGFPQEEVNRRVDAALQQMNLMHKKDRPPHHLSFGEKRRAAIATALVLQADLLLLDEPTSNLDPASRRELIEYLTAIPAAKVIATHDLELARTLCPTGTLLADGKQVVTRPTRDILADLDLLRRYRLAP